MLLGFVNKTTTVVWPVVCTVWLSVPLLRLVLLTYSSGDSLVSKHGTLRITQSALTQAKFLSAKGLKPTGPCLTTGLGNRCTFALWSSFFFFSLWSSWQMLLRHIVSGSLEGSMGLSICGGQLDKATLCSLSFAVRSLCPLPWNHFANKPRGRKPLSQAVVLGDSV